MLTKYNEAAVKQLNEKLEKEYRFKIGIQGVLNAMVEFCLRQENLPYVEKYIGLVRISELKQRRIKRLQKDLVAIDRRVRA